MDEPTPDLTEPEVDSAKGEAEVADRLTAIETILRDSDEATAAQTKVLTELVHRLAPLLASAEASKAPTCLSLIRGNGTSLP